MDRAELIARITPIISTYAQDKDAVASINESTDFIKDLKINSANLVDVILDIEEEFDIEIDNLSMERMLNVSAAMEVIEDKLKTK